MREFKLGDKVVCYGEGEIVGLEIGLDGETQYKVRYGVYGKPGYGIAFLPAEILERPDVALDPVTKKLLDNRFKESA